MERVHDPAGATLKNSDRSWTRPAVLAALVCAAACAPVPEQVPEETDALAHWLWLHYPEDDDAIAREAVDKLLAKAPADVATNPDQGLLSYMSHEEFALVGLGDADPATAQGMLLFDVIDCNFDALERVLYDLDQKRYHNDAYATYERSYTSDFAAYQARTDKQLSWFAELQASFIPGGELYTERLRGGLRYLSADAAGQPRLLARTYMTEPVVFGSADTSFSLDFHLEAFAPRSDGTLVHFVGLWREVNISAVGWDSDDVHDVQMMLDSFVDWDKDIEAGCRGQ